MKNSLSVLFVFFFYISASVANDAVADSILSIKTQTARFNAIRGRYTSIRANTQADSAFKKVVSKKGSAAEKILVNFISKNKPFADAKYEVTAALCDNWLPLALKNGDPHLIAYLYLTKANALMALKQYTAAFESFLYVHDFVKKDPEHKFFGEIYAMNNLAFALYLFKQYDAAIEICKHLVTLAPAPGFPPGWLNIINADLMGAAYFRKEQYDSAKLSFGKAMQYAVDNNNQTWIAIMQGDLGLVAYQQGNYKQADSLLQKGSEWCYVNKFYDNSAIFASTLAKLYSNTGRLAEVPALLKESAFANDAYYKLENRLSYFEALSLYNQKTGNWKMAYVYADSASKYEILIANEYNNGKMILAESHVAYDKKNAEAMMAVDKVKWEKQVRYAVIALSVVMIFSIILFYQRKKLKYLLRREKLELENLKAEEELHLARRDIEEFKRNVTFKNRLLEHYITEVGQLKEQTKQVTDSQIQSIEDLKRMNVLTDEDWNSFKNMFEKVHPGFMDRLTQQYPTLTPAEIRYTVFTKLNMGSKEMASMLGISAEGLRNIRFRLLKKTELGDVKLLEKVVEDL